jgi:riboflavin kinase/FMN adenylyltransferase
MQVFRNINELSGLVNPVITIGTFDGVHLGHRKIIERINQIAKEKNGQSVIITFHPHPRFVINPEDTSLKLISTVDEKVRLLESCGVDVAVIIPFSREFSEQSPEDYIENFLVKYFHPSCIVIGYDHKFGRDRKGDFAMLQRFKEQFNYDLVEISKQNLDDITISSTKIRHALLAGEITKANELLGYNYSISGLVIKGLQNGRKLGYPTANMQLIEPTKLTPQNGIYAVYVYVEGVKYAGMLSIGFNPTFGGKVVSVEVNILNFDQDIYGQMITIEFVKYIRSEKKFDNLQDLIKAIDNDKILIEREL